MPNKYKVKQRRNNKEKRSKFKTKCKDINKIVNESFGKINKIDKGIQIDNIKLKVSILGITTTREQANIMKDRGNHTEVGTLAGAFG